MGPTEPKAPKHRSTGQDALFVGPADCLAPHQGHRARIGNTFLT
jgi:hypothetical protein